MDDWMEMATEVEFEFTLAEIVELENLYKEMRENSLNQQFCEEIATKFSGTPYRCGKSIVTWEQVHSWFLETKRELETKVSSFRQKPKEVAHPVNASMNERAVESPPSVESEEFYTPLDETFSNNEAESSPKPKGERVAELSELVFEARSSKDFAWFDVASFLNYRITHSGELEVRVRFFGFDKDEDEWVNVKRAVRQRSVPLEQSECHTVKVGDLVLCFREGEDRALHCDARILKIKRSHDTNDCRCIFLVSYDHDNFEEEVPLNRLCRRSTR